MRLPISRRSVSSWVSPGPRSPMPPFWRSRWVHPRTRRVDRCLSCASSTSSLPSALRARLAKMSRIRPARSSTRRPTRRSRLRSCEGDSSWSTRTTSAESASARSRISSALPLPTKKRGSGTLRLPVIVATGTAPADRASASNSPSSSASGGRPSPMRTRIARSPRSGRSNKGSCRLPGQAVSAGTGVSSSAPSADGRRTLRAGTTVEMACL